MARAASNVVPLREVSHLGAPAPLPSPAPAETTRQRRSFGKVMKLRSGRYQASYVGKDGARHLAPVTFDNKGDAGAWLDMRHAELLEYRWKPAAPAEPEPLSFREYSATWLRERELKPRTRAEYAKLLATLVEYFGDAQLREITSADIKTWYQTLDPSKRSARAHLYSMLRTLFATAAHDELIGMNPCRIRGASTSKRQKAIRPATLAELEALTLALPERYRALVMMAAWCALRFGELTELRRKDLELTDAAGVVRVRRAVTWPNASTPVVGTPKSEAGVRDVAIPPHLLPMLRHHLDTYAQPGPDGLLFPNTEGAHLHHGSMYKVFKRARNIAGRPDLRFHDLRHTGATMAARSGATLAELMNRLGHSTVGAAIRYQHASDDRDAEIARRLSDLANGAH
ncbi:Site-specific recombinase XerD [Tessaracoccus bendigoensis DSM 12906]|uniref:Site-specific recombinase XerD n=1 Tax=Tessaracoccus bendigoensis DSM 12906 TaxID=1123357 RepID=A0A1M6HW72_9ACTN|nr:Site-specific recombinase XerD [Tessaracoccus bendigoensis DSM 12906]